MVEERVDCSQRLNLIKFCFLVNDKNAKDKLREILKRVSNPQISLLEIRKIFDGEFRSILENNSGNKKLNELVEESTEAFAKRVGEFRKNWLENKSIEPTNEELDTLEYFN